MATRQRIAPPEEGEFTVYVEAQLTGTDSAQLIRAFDQSFASYARERGLDGARLRVARAGSGSFWATFRLWVELYDFLSKHKDIVAMFMHDFSSIVSAIEQGVTRDLPKNLLDLARTI